MRYSARAAPSFIVAIPASACRYLVTNNVLIYNAFMKYILFCLRRATRESLVRDRKPTIA
ncbi:hypothetical protein E4N04_20400 [Salmonella enterica]|nr:hypothetical protein [Salmonella enterica]EAW1762604.1 hypothetical protein [Salmonella enterica subsp. enterica]